MNEEMNEVPVEEVPLEAIEAEVDPMDNLMQVLAELQERYGISQEEMDAVVDCINAAFDVPVEESVVE